MTDTKDRPTTAVTPGSDVPRDCMLNNPGVMLGIIAHLVHKLGGTFSITEAEMDSGPELDMEEEYDGEGGLTLTTRIHGGGH